ncbi:hypothetical protein [Candidatus Nitrososphaera sp. FF02]|uniref:hypothetical protein n=1 Tax=Candidatus Nitrososphaera sp. FF02 TaxID=3398226 RepID=UPI0039EBD4D0
MHLIGNYSIKHGEKIPIYNVYGNIYGTEVGTRKNPEARRTERSVAASEIGKNAFLFTNIEVLLDVTDAKTMMTHHTVLWSLVNQRDEPVDRVFYYIDGDTPQDFPEINFKATDEDGKELTIQSLDVNKPYHKEFFVKLNRPLRPNQKGRQVRFEYDWEEPERQYTYKFSSDCKKFHFLLTLPKGVEVSQKVARASPETGDKEYASTPASVRYLKDRTEMEWRGSDISIFTAYRFDW